MTDPTKSGPGRAIDWAFRDRTTGAITIAQRPNLPLWLFLALTALAWLAGALSPPPGPVAGWLGTAAHLALAWWAVDEVLRGVNPWRRLLGAAALLWLGTLLVAGRAA